MARRAIEPMIAAPGRDGDLSRLAAALGDAEAAGLLDRDGEVTLWADDELACAALEEVAATCAGVATCLHLAGVGAVEAATWRPAGRSAVALLEQPLALGEALARGDAGLGLEARLELGGDEACLSGRKRFVYAAPQTRNFVVFARSDAGWQRVLVGAEDVELARHGQRVGLAACWLVDLQLEGTRVRAEHVSAGAPLAVLARTWLGLAAIAVGNARGALVAAARYARERYQGGGQSDEHDATRRLLGRAEARVVLCRDAVASEAARRASARSADQPDEALLRRAALLESAVTRDCAEAVSDCLQVLGGYGYMEEYRLEKRLRDAMTLRAMLGTPDELAIYAGATVGRDQW